MYFNKAILLSNIAQILYGVLNFIPTGQNKLHLVIISEQEVLFLFIDRKN
jgi:hypothetical protein